MDILKNVKVKAQELWWNRDTDTKVGVTSININGDTVGYYYLYPTTTGERTYTYKARWEEVSILQTGEGVYEVAFWAVSSSYVRSDNPFLVLEMTQEQLVQWNKLDVWFREEMWYVVRRKGNKFTKSRGNGADAMRCIQCRYLITESNPHDHVCKDTPYYMVDDHMQTVRMR